MRKILFLLIGFISLAVNAAEFVLVKDSKPQAQIVFEQTPDRILKRRVKLFNSYVKKVTGTELKTEGTNLPYTIKLNILPVKLGSQFEWKMEFPSAKVMRITATEHSVFEALNEILERGADTRFLGMEACMFQYEPRKDLSIAVEPLKSRAGYSVYRGMYWLANHETELGFTGGPFKYTHGIPDYAFPRQKYGKGLPECVAPLQKGKKTIKPARWFVGWQPCYSNKEAADIAIKNILEIVREKKLSSITLGVNDSRGYCECEACKEMDKDARTSIFHNYLKSHGNSYYTFCNRIAEAVCKEFPDLRIGLLAYTGTIMPPNFPVHKNLVPMMTFDSVLGAFDPEVRKKHFQVIAEWGKLVKETGTWEYRWGRNYLVPRVNFKNQAEFLRYLYDNGGRAFFGENGLADTLDGPKLYLTSRQLKDIHADPDKILEEWYTRFAGKAAAPALKKIYRMCEEYWLSDEMKQTPLYSSRHYIYSYPTEMHMYALKPGFTAELVRLANEVCRLAKTPGEKKRAEVLLRHFEQVDCVASFQAMAYLSPKTGEIASEQDALAYYKMLERDLPRLLAQYKRAGEYFAKPDVPDENIYLSGKRFELQPDKLLAAGYMKTFQYMGNKEITALMEKLKNVPGMPAYIKTLTETLVKSSEAKNYFEHAGFTRPLKELPIRTSLPYEITDEVLCNGQKTLKVYPGRPNGTPNPFDIALCNVPAVRLTQAVPPGIWAVTAQVYTPARKGQVDLCLWALKDGSDRSWEALHQSKVPAKKWTTFLQIRTIDRSHDGVGIHIRPSGFSENEPLYIGNIRLVRLGDGMRTLQAPMTVKGRHLGRRGKSVVDEVAGLDAVVTRNPKTYDFAHFMFSWDSAKPDDVMELSFDAAIPENCKSGRVCASVYGRSKGKWSVRKRLVWNVPLEKGKYKTIKALVTAKEVGDADRYMILFFKIKGTEGAAVSRAALKFYDAKDAPVLPKVQPVPVPEKTVKKIKKVSVQVLQGTFSAKEIGALTGSKTESVRGEQAVSIKNPKAYDFAHVIFYPKGISPEDTMEFNIRAALPDGVKNGKLGAILFIRKGNKWVRLGALFWNRVLTEKFTDIKVSFPVKTFGKDAVDGRYRLLIYKMTGTEGAAVSEVNWKIKKNQ